MPSHPLLSIVIPTYHEETHLAQCLKSIHEAAGQNHQIIIVDASEDDKTAQSITVHNHIQFIKSPKAQRAFQLNHGADHAQAEILFFLHADSIVPSGFDHTIFDAVSSGIEFGQFSVRYDGGPFILRLQERMSRSLSPFSGGGDQGLWITRDLYNRLNGFNVKLNCMEDFDLFKRARKISKPIILPEHIISSARKYDKTNYLRVQGYNLSMLIAFYLTSSSRTINKVHRHFSY